MNEQVKARAGVLLANFFFGTSVIAVKHITPSLMSPMALSSVRIMTVSFLFWSMYAARPVKTNIVRKDYYILFACAMTGILMNQTFTMYGFSMTSPIHASLLILSTPITITVLAVFFLKEKFSLQKVIGLLLGISGGAMLVFSRDISSKSGGQQTLGDLFVIAGAVSYSVYVIMIKPLMAKYKATHILQWVFLFACIISVPLAWKNIKEVRWESFDGLSWFCLAYVILGATFFAYQMMNYGIKKIGAGITGSYIYTQPFFAALASMLILHETLSLEKLGAASLIIAGVFITNYRNRT